MNDQPARSGKQDENRTNRSAPGQKAKHPRHRPDGPSAASTPTRTTAGKSWPPKQKRQPSQRLPFFRQTRPSLPGGHLHRLFHIDELQLGRDLFLPETPVTQSFIQFQIPDTDIAGKKFVARFGT